MCVYVCISKITTGIILHLSFLDGQMRLSRIICRWDDILSLSESKMLITCKFVGGFDKVVNHMFL